MISLGGPPQPQCSRVSCTEAPSSAIAWRNPRIHPPERTKTWLACDTHTSFLRDFLAARDFPVTVTPFDTTTGPQAAEIDR